MKKVLHVIGYMNRAGAETMIMNVYRHIDRSKIQFDFIVYEKEKQDYEDEIVSLGGRVIHIPIKPGLSMIKSIFAIRKVLISNGPYCAIHAATLFNSVYPMIASLGIPGMVRIVHSHSSRSVMHRSLARVFYENVSRLLIKAICHKQLACGIDAGKYIFGKGFTKKGIVLNNSIDIDRFFNIDVEYVGKLEQKLATDGKFVIGNVARLAKVKNHKKMLSIAAALKKKNVKFRMLLIGQGPLKDEIAEQIEAMGLGDDVVLLGMREDIPDLLHLMDVFILPSYFEGNPVSLIEAQAAGVPCVVSDVVTNEIDMGMGLIAKVKLDASDSVWAENMLSAANRSRPDKDTVVTCLKTNGYDIEETTRLLTDIYLTRI